MNGSKSKTSSSKSSTEGGPAPQRFDVAAMVSLAARCRGAGWRHPHASAAVCARFARRQRVRLLCERLAAVVAPRSGRARRQAASAALAGEPAAAALAQQSCRVAEAEHRDDPCATTGSDGSCMRL